MATLTGQQIDQSYQGLIKTNDNAALSATAKGIQDGTGGATNIEMSNTSTNFVSGTVDFTGSTVSGLPDNNTTYTVNSVQDGANADIKLTDQLGNDSKVTLVAGTNITLSNTGNDLTITAASGGAAGLENGSGSDSLQSAAALTTTAADASGSGAISVGDASDATGLRSVAIGFSSQATGVFATAYGPLARAVTTGGVAIGNQAKADGSNSTAIGPEAGYISGVAQDAIGIGYRAGQGGATGSVSIGKNATATATDAVALGQDVTAATANTVSVKALETQTDGGVQIKGDGTNAGKLKLYCEDASGAHNITLEGPAHAGGATYTLKFPNVQSTGTQILQADASGNLAWINTPAGGGGSPGLIAGVGTDSIISDLTATSAVAPQSGGLAIGSGANAYGSNANAIGLFAEASSFSNAFGTYSGANGSYSTAFGSSAQANGQFALSVGKQSVANSQSSIALGEEATVNNGATSINGIAIGKLAEVTASGGVAIGESVTAATANTVTIKLLQIANYASMSFADDTAAAAGGIPLGGVYHTSGALKIRIV